MGTTRKTTTRRKPAAAAEPPAPEPVRLLLTRPLGGELMDEAQLTAALQGRTDSPLARAVVQILEAYQQRAQDLAQQPKTAMQPGLSAYYNGAAAWTFDALWEIVRRIQGTQAPGGRPQG